MDRARNLRAGGDQASTARAPRARSRGRGRRRRRSEFSARMRCARPRLIVGHSLAPEHARHEVQRKRAFPWVGPPPPLVLERDALLHEDRVAAAARLRSGLSGPSRLSSSTSARAVGRGVPVEARTARRGTAPAGDIRRPRRRHPQLTLGFSRAGRAVALDFWRNRGPWRCAFVTGQNCPQMGGSTRLTVGDGTAVRTHDGARRGARDGRSAAHDGGSCSLK